MDKNILRNPKYINAVIIHLMKVQKNLIILRNEFYFFKL